MEKRFLSLLKDPATKGDLSCFIFEQEEDNILEGILLSADKQSAYPIMAGVPVMLKDAFPDQFKEKHRHSLETIEELKNIRLKNTNAYWSFSSEWEEHSERELTVTWGWTVNERFQQFLAEVDLQTEEAKDKVLLDAGCGNGQLTDYMGEHLGTVVGLDYSNSVFAAEKARKSKNVLFVQGDIQSPPFAKDTFDLIVSNGVIHHTRSTETTFYSLAQLAKMNGRVYIWLYSRKGKFMWRFKRRCFDIGRVMVSRMGKGVQKVIVNMFTAVLAGMHKQLDKEQIRIDMYDSLTPRWRHYHTPEEVAYWYYRAGFGPVALTHFDNRFGFGVYAVRKDVGRTPGENFHD